MEALTIIEKLAATSSRIDKEQIIFGAFMEGHRDFFVGARLALDPLITFGVKKVALIEEEDDEPGTLSFSEFLTLAQKLRKRELTGNAARDAINYAASICHAKTWNNFYRRILLKDLKIGVESSTINKVLNKVIAAKPEANEYIIPIFSCQLAHDGADEKHAKKISGEKLLDIKLDGVRLLTVLDKETGQVTQYTRNGKVNENFIEITDALRGMMADLPGSVVLDGEVISTSFQELMTQVNRREGVDTSKTRLAIFDIVPLDDFRAGICRKPQEERHKILTTLAEAGLFQKHTGNLVYVIPKVFVDLNSEEGQAQFVRFNKEAIAAGYEGIMVKDPRAPYETKRSAAWLKIKPFIEVSLAVQAVEEGKPDGKYVGQMGALVCAGEDDGKQILVNVGSGFTDEQRKEFWENRDKLIGMIAEVRADALTLERDSTVYSMRFPRWKGWRGTKPGEKL